MTLHLQRGFTLIEIIVLIVVTGLLANVILLATLTTMKNTPTISTAEINLQKATACMEWFYGQRQLNGYSSISCPSSTVPAFCASGVTVNITCLTINTDANYQQITVTSGNTSLTGIIANY